MDKVLNETITLGAMLAIKDSMNSARPESSDAKILWLQASELMNRAIKIQWDYRDTLLEEEKNEED